MEILTFSRDNQPPKSKQLFGAPHTWSYELHLNLYLITLPRESVILYVFWNCEAQLVKHMAQNQNSLIYILSFTSPPYSLIQWSSETVFGVTGRHICDIGEGHREEYSNKCDEEIFKLHFQIIHDSFNATELLIVYIVFTEFQKGV